MREYKGSIALDAGLLAAASIRTAISDAGSLPRLDPETNEGLVTDVGLKRKIRNYAELAKGGGYAIYVQEGAILSCRHRDGH